MLALVALADLPTPIGVRFVYGTILSLSFDNLADGRAWSRHLGGSTDTYVNDNNGHIHLREGSVRWHGWSVNLHAFEPVSGESAPPDLDAATAARLALVAGAAVAR
jgi:hypothetical protein